MTAERSKPPLLVRMAAFSTRIALAVRGNVQTGNSRSETRPLLRHDPLRNPVLLFGTLTAQLVHIGAMYTPGLRDVLEIQPVPFEQWALTLALALSLFLAIELQKGVIRARRPRPRPAPG